MKYLFTQSLAACLMLCTLVLGVVFADNLEAKETKRPEHAYDPAEARAADVSILKQKLADEEAQLKQAEQQLATQQAHEAQWVSQLETQAFDPKLIHQAELAVNLAKIQQDKTNVILASVEENIDTLKDNIRELEKRLLGLTPEMDQFMLVSERLIYEQEKLTLQQARQQTLRALDKINVALVEEQIAWLQDMHKLEKTHAINTLMGKQLAEENRLQSAQQQWEEKLKLARETLLQLPESDEKLTQKNVALQDQIVEAEENIQLLMIKFNFSRIATYSSILLNYPPEDLSREHMQTHEKLDRLLTDLS
ncbi:MAG TPA: hypothetical protein VI522_06150, partial [Gammaproteobacteria bacterium]|nr:hypothetical protein [Gammaproteobacteria bacterium]